MKKETKKKVFNFALATTIVASVATPLSIVLGKESNLLFNKNLRQTTNNSQFVGSSYINDNDYTLDLNSALGNQSNNNNRTISVGTSNIVKSIPQGYIVVSGDSNNKNQELICLDKNDPTKALWKLNLSKNNSNTNINIYGVEYTPYDGGRLIVLYSEDANDDTHKTTTNSSQIKFKVFKNLDNNTTPQLDFAGFSWQYQSGWENDSGGRLDTWAINPIFNFSGQVNKYLIYCKEQYFTNNDNNGRTRFYLLDLNKTHSEGAHNCEAIQVRWEGAKYNGGKYDGNKKIILSLASFEENNNIYTLPLIIDFVENKLELDVYKVFEKTSNDNKKYLELNNSNTNDEKKHAIQFNTDVMKVDDKIFQGSNSNQELYNKAADLVKTSISSSTFQRTNDEKLKVAFAINMSPNGTNNTSPHRGSKLILIGINKNKVIDYQIKDLFSNNYDLLSKEELWHGYFANEVIAKNGIDSTINNSNLTPFISMGWSEEKLGTSKQWFSSVIKNPFSATNYDFDTNKTSHLDNFRVYRVNNGNAIDSTDGIYSGNVTSNYSQFGYGQFGVGFPILEYNDEIENNDIFNRNILFTWNKQPKAIIINQKNHDQNINSTPTYGYHTRFLKNEINYSVLSLTQDMDQINEEKIISLKDQIVTKFEGKNIIINSDKVSNIAFNYVSGTITFDLEVSKYFDEKGIFKNDTKSFNLTINGFNKKPETTIKENIDLNKSSYNNIHSHHLIPSINVSYPDANNNNQNLKLIVLNQLKTDSTILGTNFRKEVKNLNVQEDFGKVFTKFEMTNYSNTNGTITVNITIDKKYVYTDNKDLEKTVTFSGLRKIGETKLISNEKESPLEIESFSETNIQYSGNKLENDISNPNGAKILTEDELKDKLIEKVINEDYKSATAENGYDTGEGTSKLTKHLPYKKKYSEQDAKDPSSYKLTKSNIILDNYEFFAGNGILKVDVKLNVWNGSDNQLHDISSDSTQSNPQLTSAPSATWYISGFKYDNVETKFKKEEVWKLSGIETITVEEFKLEENKEKVENALLEYLRQNKTLIDFPYWVNKDDVLSKIQIEFDPNDIKVDESNPKQATLKVRLKDNMWLSDAQGKVEDKKTNAEYQKIIISGFLNPTPIKLTSDNLKNIKVSGNTKYISIDEKTNESQIFSEVDEDSKKFLEIQYSVEGINQWFNKDKFIEELKKLNGSIDNENWIIRREDIKARYALKQQYDNGKIFLEIDGEIITSNQAQNKKISIIDESHNQDVKGYINIDKITDKFKEENFEVRGTDKSPKLIIKNVEELNNLFSRYSSNNIFEILYSDKQDGTNFEQSNAIWKNDTSQLTESMNLNGTFTNEFSLSFRGTQNYEVYLNNQKQDNGYILKTPGIKMVISIEIDNPLRNKDVKFNFKNKENKEHFYQNKGGFWVRIGDKNSSNNLKEFSDFINEQFSSDKNKKDALELAYYVSEYEMQEQELKQIHAEENLYNDNDLEQKYGVWKTLETSNWEKELGLLVNDYVVVTIRVKKDNLTTEDKSGYAINYDQDYIPFQQRVYGYKIKTNEIKINENSIQLKNVGQAESASYALDGYARLKHLSLEEDQDKNYLGAAIKINYFNEFYKKDDQILVSGSGQVLVKRESGTKSIEYKDKDGQPIKDNGSNISLQLNQDGTPTTPTKNASSNVNIELKEYSPNSFRFSDDIEATELKYNFFQNQYIEFEFVNKKGKSTEPDEYDYYVDKNNVKIEYTFKNIKFPINNDSNISYEFNSQEFIEKISNPNNLKNVYQNSLDSNKEPINGQSKLVEMFNVTRKENNKPDQELKTLLDINNKIKEDFAGQVKLVATYTSVDGQIRQIEGGDISTIETLKNGDRFKIEIISNSSDLIFAQQPNPLIFAVQGLYEQPIDQGLLKYLRVKQGGIIDGQGSFNILVDDWNQSNSNSDIKTLLSGYKFLVRVWNKDKTIKHDWTENFISINNLKNGDKVEWKLVSPNGSPLVDSYYNTIANVDKHNVNENKYSFIQINQEGFAGKNINNPKEGIGKIPEQSNIYPEDSGLVISGLKSEDDSSYTTITFEEFTRVMNLMNFGYSGINGSGNMISSTRALDVKLNVVGRNSETFTLDYLIKNNYISFYYNNDSSSQLNSFNWDQVKDEKGNWLTSPGTLSNGDSVRIVYKDPTMSTSYEYYAPIVSGLQNKSDNMSMFSWIGIGVASFVTLGIFAFIYIYVRNRKLK